jgi:hypothetical protein
MAPDSSASESNLCAGSTSDEKKDGLKWTVMVFMGADTIRGNQPLDDAAEADLDEIRFVGGAETLDVFVQIHHSVAATQRYHFGFDRVGKKQIETKREMPGEGSDQHLIRFVTESLGESKHRPADHSILVLWGHAYDFAFGRRMTRGGVVDAIDFVELSGMLQRLQDTMKTQYAQLSNEVSEGRPTLDIIGFDACDVATVELACQLQPFAKYLLGSEIGIPIPGWPYDRILDRLKKPHGRLMTPPEFGSYVVRRFCESYPASSPVSLTFLNLAQATELKPFAKVLALALLVAIGDTDKRHRIMDLFTRSQTGEDRPYVDVVDLCLNLVRYSADPLVAETARALGDLLLSSRPPLVGNRPAGTRSKGGGLPFIVDHGRNAGELARLNGISLYAPHVAFGNDFGAVRSLYDKFAFAQETVWSGLVHALAKPS